MFSYTLLKAHFRAGLLADWVSGTNKHDGSPESTLDKRSEAATNRGRSCHPVKAEMKERQLPWTGLGPYRAGWVLCQTRTIISGPRCVESSKSSFSFFFILSHLCICEWIMQSRTTQSLYSEVNMTKEYATACLKWQHSIIPTISLFIQCVLYDIQGTTPCITCALSLTDHVNEMWALTTTDFS